jgi:PHD/YefM family antitoxin component YafN of YafNO toxin-antitoxin module
VHGIWFTARHNCDIIMSIEMEVFTMPVILPIRDLRNTSEISNLAHKKQEPIFITKNGYSDLVVMSSELYESFAQINKVDRAIFEAEKEVEDGAEPIDVDNAMERLNKKYYG